ncbi:2-succinylbenzoate--CoA ligase [Cupriavidus yeoncheonensis]|uniref:2-succinylbenzoate--CoA ligase n=1 Tax=Cupriavidus yeoncheonensis TaxID=1462994 RepID=A0A916NFN4_9BURK|nr:acyl-CoA synthetase [Cupriavidus yeoncheonensis]CAG2155132.1 2-succinylbenzoate--CoA ligase [Cupriavidus yeoncheonensis]
MPDTTVGDGTLSGEIRTQADIDVFERTPWQEKVPAQNTYELLCRACDRHQEQTALRFVMTGAPDAPEFTVNYASLKARVTQAANAFFRAGVTPGTAVTVLLPNLPETHYALLGAQAAGIASPINPMLEVDYIAAIVEETGAQVLVACAPMDDSTLWDKAIAVVDRCRAVRTLFVVSATPYVGEEERKRLEAAFEAASRPARVDVNIVGFEEALAAEPSDTLVSERRILPTDICSYFHTGGTTGLPKVATHAHLNEAFVASMLSVLTPSSNTILCGLPLFHVNGAMVTGLAAFHSGWEVVMLTAAGYRGHGVMANFWKLVERFRANSFSGVPTIYSTLADLPRDGADISSLRFAFCGAAPLPAEVARRFEAAAGIPLYEGYGMTEGACVSALSSPLGERRLGSVGLRLPHQAIGVWKSGSAGLATEPAAPGETGVIGIHGPNVFPGYLQEHDNRGIWLKPGWLNTGDLGYLDADGYLHLTGRAKELIIRGGHNIDPAMIEEALLQHPAVAMAAAVSQPDAHAGELPVAYVTLKPGHVLSADELLAAARTLVPERAAVPARVEILQALPLTPVGKVARAELRMRAVEEVFREHLALAGVPANVRVGPDIRRGTVAFIQCAAADAERVRDLLVGRFPFPLDFTHPA